MIRKIAIAILTLFLAASMREGVAQTAPPDPVRDALIPPDVVMSHQQELGLSETQRSAIVSDTLTAQAHFVRVQPKLEAATAKLVDVLRRNRVDQTQALAQMDAVLALEREIKHAQLAVMIQVKNELTPQQQATAYKIEMGSKP